MYFLVIPSWGKWRDARIMQEIFIQFLCKMCLRQTLLHILWYPILVSGRISFKLSQEEPQFLPPIEFVKKKKLCMSKIGQNKILIFLCSSILGFSICPSTSLLILFINYFHQEIWNLWCLTEDNVITSIATPFSSNRLFKPLISIKILCHKILILSCALVSLKHCIEF